MSPTNGIWVQPKEIQAKEYVTVYETNKVYTRRSQGYYLQISE